MSFTANITYLIGQSGKILSQEIYKTASDVVDTVDLTNI